MSKHPSSHPENVLSLIRLEAEMNSSRWVGNACHLAGKSQQDGPRRRGGLSPTAQLGKELRCSTVIPSKVGGQAATNNFIFECTPFLLFARQMLLLIFERRPTSHWSAVQSCLKLSSDGKSGNLGVSGIAATARWPPVEIRYSKWNPWSRYKPTIWGLVNANPCRGSSTV